MLVLQLNRHLLVTNSNANVLQQNGVRVSVRTFKNRTALLSFTNPQFVVTHTIRQTELPALLHTWDKKQSFCQNVVSTKISLSLYFREK